MTTYGALFAGYGGLELGVQSVLGGHLSWYAEIDQAPSRVMAHHYPGVPNLGNGVVPQQAAAATAAWVADTRSERAA